MNLRQKLSAAMLAASIGVGGAGLQAANYVHYIPATTCGTWNSAGVHSTSTDYQIGYSTQLPNEQAAYFEIDLDSVKGQTVSSCVMYILGSPDYNITCYWVNPDNLNGPNNTNTIHEQFKVGMRPQGADTLSEVLTGNNNVTVYTDAADANRNQDLGYTWASNGVHPNQVFDTDHYNPSRLQTEVNAGGDWIFWACDDDDTDQSGGTGVENYIWGTTTFNNQLILEITTTTGPTSGTPPKTISDGLGNATYRLINKNTGLALDVEGAGTANGTLVDSWPYNGKSNDQWALTGLGNSCYELVGVGSGRSLDVQGQSVNAGALLDIYTYNDQTNQQWLIVPGIDSGTYTIEGIQSGNFVQGAAKGQSVTMQPNDGNPDQEWTFSAP
jgi:hypothetical protein